MLLKIFFTFLLSPIVLAIITYVQFIMRMEGMFGLELKMELVNDHQMERGQITTQTLH